MCKTLLKDPILKGYFTKFCESYGIKVNHDMDESAAFRRFVDYTLLRVDTPDVFTGNFDLLDFVCLEPNNTVFDGLGIKLNGHLIQSVDDIVQFVDSIDRIVFEFVFIRIGSESKDDLSEYCLFSKEVLKFVNGTDSVSDKFEEYADIIKYIYTDDSVARKMDENPKLVLQFVPAKSFKRDSYEDALRDVSRIIDEGTFYLGGIIQRIVSGTDIVSFCNDLENKFSRSIKYREQLQLALTGVEKIENAISFTCQARELMKLLTKEDGSLRRSLFNDNVRDYLGVTSVNEEIENTIRENPGMFLLCNNGITIVCSKFEPQKEKGLKIESPQIVNGCQTCTSLFNLKDSPELDKVQVQVRLICTDDTDITNQIVRGTNKQNFVLDEAFETLRPFHQRLEKYFDLRYKIAPNEAKLYYERRTKQYSNNASIPKYQIVNSRIITQTFVGMFLNQPHVAHRHEAKLLEIFGSEDRQIYCDDHELKIYFLCAYTWYRFEEFFRLQKIPRKYKVYKAHLYLLFRLSLKKPFPGMYPSDDVDRYCDDMMKLLVGDCFDKHVGMVLESFEKAMNIWTNEGGSVYGMKDRKDFTELILLVAGNMFNISEEKYVKRDWYQGTIKRFSMRGTSWIGIIKPDTGGRNITFDSRGFDGEERKIIPGVRVQYRLKRNQKHGISYADQVTIMK